MSTLDNQQKQLIFDYSLGLTTEKETAEAEELIRSDKQAAEFHSALKSVTSVLDSLESELCPDELVERTVLRLTNTSRASQARLAQLLADEQARTVAGPRYVWWNIGRVLAAAAVILIVAGIWFAPLNFVRQKYYYPYRCKMQLARIAGGINQYMADHDGQMPTVATAAGAPWWKVGYQGNDNYSNTRHLWLLPRGGYVAPADFVCPGARQGQVVRLDSSQVKDYNDFPDRKHVTFSFRIRCNKPRGASTAGRMILISDLNPLFEVLPGPDETLIVRLNKELLNLNSANHNRTGQNVLLDDGSVKFLKTRHFGAAEDDIFTLQNTKVYQGVEVPLCETDTFLAP